MLRRSGLLLAIAACVLFGVLPAASAAAAPDAKGTVTFVFWDYGPDVQKGWETTLQNFKTANPGITVDLVGAQGNSWGEYLDKVATMIAGGKKLDTIWVATEGIRQLATKGLIRPIDDLVARDKAELQDYFNDVPRRSSPARRWTESSTASRTAGTTWSSGIGRASSRQRACLRPSPHWTRADFLRYAQKLTKDNVYGYAVENAYFVGTIPWIYANGEASSTSTSRAQPRILPRSRMPCSSLWTSCASTRWPRIPRGEHVQPVPGRAACHVRRGPLAHPDIQQGSVVQGLRRAGLAGGENPADRVRRGQLPHVHELSKRRRNMEAHEIHDAKGRAGAAGRHHRQAGGQRACAQVSCNQPRHGLHSELQGLLRIAAERQAGSPLPPGSTRWRASGFATCPR